MKYSRISNLMLSYISQIIDEENAVEKTMCAAVIERFGSIDELSIKEIPVPQIDANEVLINVKHAGIGQWDTFEREGGYDKMLGLKSKFPYVLGSEGSGVIVSTGKNVTHFHAGDKVYATGFLNPKGGFYAEYVAINQEYVSFIPKTYTSEQAAVFSGVGLTALRGLIDILNIKAGETIIISGASGGVGHIAVQIAEKLGAEVFAIASGDDGVKFVQQLGIKYVVNGRSIDMMAGLRSFGIETFDKALLTTGGKLNEKVISILKVNGRAAYPFGIDPEPVSQEDITIEGYNGDPDEDILQRLNEIADSLSPHADKVFTLDQVSDAHRMLMKHYLGKLCLKVE